MCIRDRSTSGRPLTYFFKLADACIILASAVLVSYFQFGLLLPRERYLILILAVVFVATTIFSWFSIYQSWRVKGLLKELARLNLAWICIGLLFGTCMFLGKVGEDFSRLWAGWAFVVAWFFMVVYRIIARYGLRRYRSHGLNRKNVIIVGAGVLGKRACDTLLNEQWIGLNPVAFFDDDASLIGTKLSLIHISEPTRPY